MNLGFPGLPGREVKKKYQTLDGWILDTNNWTYSSGIRSQAYTNDPAAGSSISLSVADTSTFAIGASITVSSSAGSETTWANALSANTSITAAVLALNHTTTNPLITLNQVEFVINIDADVTALLEFNDKIGFIQDATQRYGIIAKVAAYSAGITAITVYTGTDYTVTTSPISSPKYSKFKQPLGFPMSPDKWTMKFTSTVQGQQTTPTAGVWYNLGKPCIQARIGTWDVEYAAHAILSAGSGSTFNNVMMTLSTANNSESDTEMTARFGMTGASGANSTKGTPTKHKIYTYTDDTTTLYLNAQKDSGDGSTINLYIDGTTLPVIIKLRWAGL